MVPQTTVLKTTLLEQLIDNAASADAKVVRGFIVDLPSSGAIVVHRVSAPKVLIECDLLETSASAALDLVPGDQVLVLWPENGRQRGCVLGRIGRYLPPSERTARPKDRVVIEAQDGLTLQCGASSIELRKDGKLLIRGKDVVSRAERTQRIKGGTVAIN